MELKNVWYMFGPLFLEWCFGVLFFVLPVMCIFYYLYPDTLEKYLLLSFVLSIPAFFMFDIFIVHGPR